MRVLVAGGAGYIGSHMVKMMGRQGAQVTTLDDLSRAIAMRYCTATLCWHGVSRFIYLRQPLLLPSHSTPQSIHVGASEFGVAAPIRRLGHSHRSRLALGTTGGEIKRQAKPQLG